MLVDLIMEASVSTHVAQIKTHPITIACVVMLEQGFLFMMFLTASLRLRSPLKPLSLCPAMYPSWPLTAGQCPLLARVTLPSREARDRTRE